MSFFRLLILAGIVLAFVPVETEQRVAFFNSMQDRAGYLLTACERDPEFCQKTQQTAMELKHHAQHALVMGFSLVRLVFSGKDLDRNDALAIPAREAIVVSPPQETGTLNTSDRATAWSLTP